MKLLLDENLSRRLVPFLLHNYPQSSHIVLLGLERATDMDIWRLARQEGYTLVTRDADFHELSLVHGQPPKVLRKFSHSQPLATSRIATVVPSPSTMYGLGSTQQARPSVATASPHSRVSVDLAR